MGTGANSFAEVAAGTTPGVSRSSYPYAPQYTRTLDPQRGFNNRVFEVGNPDYQSSSPVSLAAQGNQGAQGSQGAQGPQGAVGAQGAQGSQGSQGAQGTQGAVGAQGTSGSQGSQGHAGSQGSPGGQGAQGPSGNQGAQGDQGTQGPQGDQGAPGSSPSGITGTLYAVDGSFGRVFQYTVVNGVITSSTDTGQAAESSGNFLAPDPNNANSIDSYFVFQGFVTGGSPTGQFALTGSSMTTPVTNVTQNNGWIGAIS